MLRLTFLSRIPGLTLTSERDDGERIYRVTAGGPTRSKWNSCISTPPVA